MYCLYFIPDTIYIFSLRQYLFAIAIIKINKLMKTNLFIIRYLCILIIIDMNSKIDIIKGIHPGIILDRELKKRKLQKSRFAISINEYPQTLVAITKAKRRMNPELALKIEHTLGIEEGFFMILQVYYDIEQIKKEQRKDYHPNLTKINPTLFWDTKIENIDWDKNRRYVIRRVLERGNEIEKEEILRFYGKEKVNEVLRYYRDMAPSTKESTNKLLETI